METVSCFLLISLSSYFYFSGADLQFFSIYSLVNIRTRDFHVLCFSSVISVPILLGFCTLSLLPSLLSNLAWSVLCPWNPPLGARVSAVSIMHIRSSGKWKLFWDAVWLKCCTAEWPKIYFMRRWLLWQGCVLQRGWAGCCLWEHMSCRRFGISQPELCAQLSTSAVRGWCPHPYPSLSYAWKSSLPWQG